MKIRPTLRQLEYFVAVAAHLNFSRAAEACFVTQPALSAQVAQLEDSLRTKLFERARPQVLLTAAGSALLVQARAILAATDDLVGSAKAFTAPFSGTLRLGAIPTIAPYLLPEVLPRVRQRYPDLRLLLREDKTERLVEALANGSLDVVVVALEAELGEMETQFLFRDELSLVVPAGHRLAKRKRAKESDLDGEDVLLLEDGHCLRGQTLSLCENAGACELGDFRASSLSTLTQMVASGVGVTLLPKMALSTEVGKRSSLVVIPFSAEGSYRTIVLGWRRSAPRADEFKALANLLLPSTAGSQARSRR